MDEIGGDEKGETGQQVLALLCRILVGVKEGMDVALNVSGCSLDAARGVVRGVLVMEGAPGRRLLSDAEIGCFSFST